MVYERCKSVKSLHLYFTRGILLNWTARGLKVLADIFLAFWRAFSRLYRCGTVAFSAPESLTILSGFWKMPVLKVSLTRKILFNLSFALVRDSSPCHFTCCFCFFLRLARDVPGYRVWARNISVVHRFPNIANFNLSSSLHLCAFWVSILPNWKVDWLYIVGQIIIFSCRSTCRV